MLILFKNHVKMGFFLKKNRCQYKSQQSYYCVLIHISLKSEELCLPDMSKQILGTHEIKHL